VAISSVIGVIGAIPPAQVMAADVIVNGGFEAGSFTGWTTSGTVAIVTSPVQSGLSAGRVGSTSPTVGDSSISQTFTVPATSGTLSFWYQVRCPETVTYGWATATLRDNATGATTTLLPRTCTNTGAWVQVSANVAAQAGHSVTLTLASHDDNYPTDPTYTLYDSVSLGGTPTPTPTPTPAPTPTPTPSPAPSGIPVPTSIDATGATDASAALYTWVRSVPDGSTIVFKAGGTYRMDQGLIVNGRRNLTFEGNGATLKSNGGTTEVSSLLRVFGATGIVIRNITLVGNSPTPGIYRPGQEGAHGIQIVMGGNIEIANVTIRNTYGDCVNTDYWTDGVRMHDSRCTYSSRCGFAIFSGKNITIERNTYDHNGGMPLDIEPYEADGGADTVQFINNTSLYQGNSRDYSQPYGPEDYFFGANGGGRGIYNITISGNTLVRGIFKGILVVPGTGLRYRNIVITNNTAMGDTVAGPTVRLAHIDGLTVTGNRVSLSSGQIANITDSTGVTYQP
jgi:hypothetical protein